MNNWTEEEKELLKLYYPSGGTKVLLSILKDRTSLSISRKAKELKISYNRGFKYERSLLEKIVLECKNYSEVLNVLGSNKYSCGNRKTLKKYIKKYGISTKHFETKVSIINRTFKIKPKIPLSNILIENSTYSTFNLKIRLYKEGLKKRECELCGQGEEWKGKKISLILDHKNGISNDNRIENLQIVCPNCNATLDTHCRGFEKLRRKKIKEEFKTKNQILKSVIQRKVQRPSYDELLSEIKKSGYLSTGKKYGVSDNAIRKWIKFYEKFSNSN